MEGWGSFDREGGEELQVPFVGVLFAHAGPFAVLWAIVAVVVLSLNGQLWWTFAHVAVESRKRVQPSVADVNSTSTVVFEVRAFLPSTSVFHGSPGSILPSTLHSMSFVASSSCWISIRHPLLVVLVT